jgi:hypothetical protein
LLFYKVIIPLWGIFSPYREKTSFQGRCFSSSKTSKPNCGLSAYIRAEYYKKGLSLSVDDYSFRPFILPCPNPAELPHVTIKGVTFPNPA